MIDRRILDLDRAAREMIRGHFDARVPDGAGDDISRLAKTLRLLGLALEKRFTELDALAKVTEKINSGLLLDQVLDHVYESFRALIPYDRIGFSLLDPKRPLVVARWARSSSPVMRLAGGFSAPLQGSSLEAILKTGRPRILNDLEEYLRAHPGSLSTRLIVEEGMRSSLTCPLVAEGKPIGFMFFSSMRRGAYRDAHRALFLELAGQLSLIVEKGRLYQRLLEVDRFKNRFLGMAAHDLRGPLGNILISAEMLLAGFHGHLNPEQADLLKELAASAVGMKKLVNDLLDVSAIEAGSLTLEPRPCAPAAVLRAGLRGRRFPAARKKIDLVEDFSPSVPESFLLDPDRLRQVIDNLVGNAVKFSPPGTRVTLEASACPEGLLVSVRDQGPGLDEDAAGLFEPFARGGGAPPPGEKSVGLGLAIAKRIVEAHGGRIWAENAPDRGAVVRFTIPSQ